MASATPPKPAPQPSERDDSKSASQATAQAADNSPVKNGARKPIITDYASL